MWNDEEDWVATAKAEGWLSPEQVQLLADALVDATLRVPSEASIVNLMESFTGSETFLNPKDSVDLDRIERSLEVSQQFGELRDCLAVMVRMLDKALKRNEGLPTMPLSRFEVESNGLTCWVTSAKGLLGRFSRFGVEVFKPVENDKAETLFSTLSQTNTTTLEDWAVFVAKMQQHHGVEVTDESKPRRLR